MPTKRKSGYSTSDNFIVPDDDDDSSAPEAKRSKKLSGNTSSYFTTAGEMIAAKRDGENNLYWEISKARRVSVSDYKGKTMISIREYYEKNDEWLPGKKGITLTLEQYASLISILPGIETELRKSGIKDVPRPNYSPAEKGATKLGDEEQEDEDEAEEEEAAATRANHEATSDEGE